MGFRIILSILILGLLTVISSATIINIPADYSTIQAGIDASSDGDTVLVHPGTYYENLEIESLRITLASLYLTTGDTSYISQTIIDGDSAGSAISVIGTNYWHYFFFLHGITMQNGSSERGGGIYTFNMGCSLSYVNVQNNSAVNGGGAFFDFSRFFLDNCSFNNNTASNVGGGLSCGSADNIYHSVFCNNSASQGGGLWCTGIFHSSNTVYRDNSAAQSGGAIYCHDDANLDSCIFLYNIAGESGGAFISAGVTIQYCLIAFNHAGILGGGMHRANSYWHEGIFIHNSTICFNSSDSSGGAIGFYPVTFARNSIVWGNTALVDSQGIDDNTTYHCNIQGGEVGNGNIDCNPGFCDSESGDFTLFTESCCIGAGCDDEFNPDSTVNIGAFGVGCDAFEFLPGDVSMSAGLWPPQVIGGDVTFLVGCFRGLSIPCHHDGFFAVADVTGDCLVIGADVSYLVNYFRGRNGINYCPEKPSAWADYENIPTEAPNGWPNCE